MNHATMPLLHHRPAALAVALLALLHLPGSVRAQVVDCSVSTNLGCSTPEDVEHCAGILSLLQTRGGDYQRWQMDLSARGGPRIGFEPLDVVGDSVTVHVDRFPALLGPNQVVHVIAIDDLDLIALDSKNLDTGLSMGRIGMQLLGDSPPLPASAGIVLPTTAGTYTAPFAGRTMTFPMATANGISIAFAPLVDVSTEDLGGCTIGGESPDHSTPHGLVRGYNVYRSPGWPSARPSVDAMFRGFSYFIDLRDFDFTQARPLVDVNRNDLVYADNPDGLPNTGDEVLVFTDAPLNPDGSFRRYGSPPYSGGFWYMLQPVLEGRLEDMEAPGLPLRSHLVDFNRDRNLDGVDIEGDGILEFYSPQADYGETGIGLMPASCPPCAGLRQKRWIFAQLNPLPADEGVVLAARAEGADVVLEWTTSLESERVASFAAFRIEKGVRQRISERLTLASGLEGATYSVRDVNVLLRRGRHDRVDVSYEVDVFGPEGEVVETAGPVSVIAAKEPGGMGAARRRRSD